MEKANVDGWEDIASGAEMMNAEKLGDWKTYIALGTERIRQGKVLIYCFIIGDYG